MASQASFSDAKKPCDAKGPDTNNKRSSFKDELDRVATEARSRAHEAKSEANPVVETVKQYIPSVATILGGQDQEAENTAGNLPPSGPPERPHHDVHIEEFVREQHKSKRDDGLLEG